MYCSATVGSGLCALTGISLPPGGAVADGADKTQSLVHATSTQLLV